MVRCNKAAIEKRLEKKAKVHLQKEMGELKQRMIQVSTHSLAMCCLGHMILVIQHAVPNDLSCDMEIDQWVHGTMG